MSSVAVTELPPNSAQAASAANRNLELVADAYGEGVVDILRLLDAQNQALVAELSAANAVYTFLFELMSVQRASGNFDYLGTAADRDEYLIQLKEYFDERGYNRRGP